jgi:hypothetical protein
MFSSLFDLLFFQPSNLKPIRFCSAVICHRFGLRRLVRLRPPPNSIACFLKPGIPLHGRDRSQTSKALTGSAHSKSLITPHHPLVSPARARPEARQQLAQEELQP